MRKSTSHCTMARPTYEGSIAALKQRHAWLARQVVEPAPGHIAVLAHFLVQCEQLMKPADFRRVPLFCATAVREQLTLRVELINASIQRDHAMVDIIEQARYTAQQHCPVCGAPVVGGDAHAVQGRRCGRHEGTMGLFTEDIRPNQKLAVSQGWGNRLRIEQSVRGEPREPVPKDAVPAVAHPLPHMIPAIESQASGSAPQITLLDSAGLRSYVERHRPKGEDKLKRAQAIAERIHAAGHERRSLGVLPDDWDALIDELARDFPNFGELAEVLRDHFALNAMGDGRVSWPPLLLIGPAGIGKTEVARWLADRLSLPLRVFDMASAQSGSPLAGSEAFWSNSEPGLLFELLAYQPQANPVLVLDELDKTEQARQYDPLAALYTLLEPRSARAFTDLSIRDFSIDASHVNWVATANSLQTIPAPILSRLTVLHVQAPTPEQAARITQTIYGRMRAEASWGSAFDACLEEDVTRRLQVLPPRSLTLALRRALGSAARAERGHIMVEDLPANLVPARRGMGFTATLSE